MMRSLRNIKIIVFFGVFLVLLWIADLKLSKQIIEWNAYSGHQRTSLRFLGVISIYSVEEDTVISNSLGRSPTTEWVKVAEIPQNLEHGVFYYQSAHSLMKKALREIPREEESLEFFTQSSHRNN